MAVPTFGKLKLIVAEHFVDDPPTGTQLTGGDKAPIFPSVHPNEIVPVGGVVLELTIAVQSTDLPT